MLSVCETVTRRLADYVDQNLELKISVEELAALVGMGRRQFQRYFKQTFGIPPHKYVLLRRVIRAQRWLAEQRPVVEIALALGFANHAHFCVVFRRFTGTSPGRYRLEHAEIS